MSLLQRRESHTAVKDADTGQVCLPSIFRKKWEWLGWEDAFCLGRISYGDGDKQLQDASCSTQPLTPPPLLMAWYPVPCYLPGACSGTVGGCVPSALHLLAFPPGTAIMQPC